MAQLEVMRRIKHEGGGRGGGGEGRADVGCEGRKREEGSEVIHLVL